MLIPFDYEFFRHGFIAAVIVGALCGFIGVFVVLRRMSYIGHGLSHAIFGGAVLSYVMNVNFFVGAGLWALLAGLLIHLISHRRWVGADAAIGVVTTSSFALGVAIVSTYRSFTRNIEVALFGNVLGITRTDLWIVVLVPSWFLPRFLCSAGSFCSRPSIPKSLRPTAFPPAKSICFSFTLLAVTVFASTQILGVTLVAAAMVIPPVIARYLTNRFQRLLILSPLIGILCGAVGMYLSFYLDVSSAATIVLTAAALFFVLEILSWFRRQQRTRSPRFSG